jgi:type IX secretion system PorP/SprF family membrane protein
MKKILATVFGLIVFVGYGQQLSLNSQYMFNEAALNPAAAGAKDYIPIHFNFRRQWSGFDGAPVSQVLTTHADMGKNLGFGGNLFNDVTGPSRTTGMNLMLSYRLRLSQDNLHSLRMGLGVTLGQHLIDITQLTTDIDDDPAIVKSYNNQFVPDVDMGVYYSYGKKAFAGLSVKNGIQMKRDLFNYSTMIENMMVRHYYLMGGYNFDLSSDFQLRTSTVLRMIESRPFQVDLNVIGQYKEMLWLGAGYRLNDAVSVMAGGQIGMVKLGYSYDFTTSDIRNYSSGSHEIFMELQIRTKKQEKISKTPYIKRNRIYSPSSN